MELFPLFSVAIVTAAVLSWVNHRFVKLPTTIGVMLIAMGMSLALFALDALGLGLRERVQDLLLELDFGHFVLDVVLAFLLFAAALHLELDDLKNQGWIIAMLATAGVLASTLIVGTLVHLALAAIGLPVPWLHALLFGALISPTDPIAVLGILKSAGASRGLSTKMAGESLFNDGIGVVAFTLIAMLAGAAGGGHGDAALSLTEAASIFAVEVGGALVLGLAAGWIAFRMMRSVDAYSLEVLLSLALATGLYSLCTALHASGPLAVVVAGLFLGNHGRSFAMSPTTAQHIDTFWELVDEILNVLLFVLIGMELLVLRFDGRWLLAGAVAVPLVLAARLASVWAVIRFRGRRRRFSPGTVQVLTWGGLRGGISIALALSLAREFPSRALLVAMTYVVVIFSIAVQGLTVGRLIRRVERRAAAAG
ncbi:MAG TPA: sodium:proton antiporter [Planctomycetota bacterium]